MKKIKSSLSECFEEQVDKNPGAIAWIENEQTITYQTLNERANQLAQYLKEEGMVPYTLVGIYGKPSIESLVAILAVIKAGGAYVGLSLQDPRIRQERILENLQPAFILCTESKKINLPKANAKLIFLQALEKTLQNYPKGNHPISSNEERLGTVIYRSDPIGLPTGVMIEQRAIINLILEQSYIDFSTVKTVLYHSDLAKESVIFEIWGALLHGLAIVSLKDRDWDKVTQEKMVCLLNTYQYDTLVQAHPAFIQNCECILLKIRANEKIPTFLPKKIVFVYGPIESTLFACYTLPHKETKSLNNVHIYLLNKKLKPVKKGKLGEIYIAGKGLSRGYLNRPELTKNRFIHRNGERLYKTGDQAILSKNGEFHLKDRIDREMIVQGELVCPEEIEAVLTEAPDIEKAYALLDKNNNHSELNVYISPDQNSVRILYDGPCQIEWDDGSVEEVKVKNISKTGIGIIGTKKIILLNEKINIRLPNLIGEDFIPAEIVWQVDKTLGIHFLKTNNKIKNYIDKFFKKNENIFSQKRNIKDLMDKKLPSYMLPVHVTLLSKIPLQHHGEIDTKALRNIYQKIKSEIIKENKDLSLTEKNFSDRNFDDQFKYDLLSNNIAGKAITAILKEDYCIFATGRHLFASDFFTEIAKMIAEAHYKNETDPIPNVSRYHPIALSVMQEKKINAGNLAIKISLSEKMTEPFLKRAIEQLLMRHEILRVQYTENPQGGVSQSVMKNFKLDFRSIDLDFFSGKIQSFIDEPFDIKKGMLFRVILMIGKDFGDELLMIFHQSISDHRSLNIAVHDLTEIIHADLEKRKPKLPILPIQYLDYAAWERECAEGSKVISSTLQACTEKISFQIGANVSSALLGYADNVQAPLPIVLLSAFYAIWSKVSGKNELAIETVMVNRDREDLRNLIGNFEKNIIICFESNASTEFKEIIENTKKYYIEGCRAEVIQNKKITIGFYFDEAGVAEFLESSLISYDLLIKFTLQENQIKGSLAYVGGAIDSAQIAAWNEEWILTLQKITSNPALILGDL